jgi:hypothetical protein
MRNLLEQFPKTWPTHRKQPTRTSEWDRGRLPSLMAEPTNATPKEKRWLMAFRGLRPVQEAVIVVVLGFLIGIIAVGIVHFML